MDRDKILFVEEFVLNIQSRVEALKDTMSVMILSDSQRELYERTIKILERKLDAIKSAETKKELKEHLRLKKLLEDKYE